MKEYVGLIIVGVLLLLMAELIGMLVIQVMRGIRKRIKVNFIFKWFDFWVGIFCDTQRKRLYFLPLPMCGICIVLATKPKDGKEERE